MRNVSVKLKVTLWYVLAMLIVSSVVFFTMNAVTTQAMERDLYGRLTGRVDFLSRKVHDFGADITKIPERDFYFAGVHMAIYDENYNLLKGQISFGISDSFDFRNNDARKAVYDSNRYLEYDKKIILKDGKIYWVKGLASFSEESMAMNNIAKNNFILIAVLILFAAAGGYLLTSRILSPVNKITATAKSIIESKDLSQRINIGNNKDELGSLANTFDEMLCEIQQAFEREQQFTSDASHELRTPVAVILSECEYMTDCAETVQDLKESAASVKDEAQKMSKLISELLTISRMDKDTLKLDFEDTELSELVNFVCMEQEAINDKNITLHRDISPGITAQADRFLIARLFINLISNAYKYNKEDGEITVSLHENEDKIIFSVSDTGIGIAKNDIPKIWERFYQVDPSRTSNENGSMGLGLSMVKWIAKRHNGEITVESRLLKGSTFTFTFPKKQNK